MVAVAAGSGTGVATSATTVGALTGSGDAELIMTIMAKAMTTMTAIGAV